MSLEARNYLFKCKRVFPHVHPFDFNIKEFDSYQSIVELGLEIIKRKGVTYFLSFMMEFQYNIQLWTAFIVLNYSDPNTINEDDSHSLFKKIEEFMKTNDKDFLNRNFESWSADIKTRYNINSSCTPVPLLRDPPKPTKK